MTQYELANLSREQHQALNELESRLGVVLLAYRPYRPEAPDGRPQAAAGQYGFEVATELDPGPEVDAALLETYHFNDMADNRVH